MASIEVNNLWVRYGDNDAVRGVDLEVNEGKIIALLGRNGAGKTSTIEAIEGYRHIHKGKIRVLGLDPFKDRKALLPKIGVMLQVGGIYPRMSARAALNLFSGYYDEPYSVDSLIDEVQLTSASNRPYKFLSGGEKQRLALALALIGKPKILFLDEPTAGVDASGKALIRQLITDAASRGTSILMTTHELSEAERICDSIMVIDSGVIAASGTASELRDRYGKSEITFKTTTQLDRLALISHLGVSIEEIGELTYRINSGTSANLVGALTNYLEQIKITLVELNAGKSSLEEVFLEITSSSDDTEP